MTLDELLLEWSYRSDKGYPSLDSPSDLSLLKEILTELNLNEEDVSSIIDELEDDPQDLGIPGDDGFEDSPVQQSKEKQFQDKQTDDTEQPKDKPEEPKKDTSATDKLYDAVIRAHLGLTEDQPIPRVNNTYPWPGKGGATFNIQVKGDDLKYWKDFWTLTPPKAGAEIGTTSKGSGDGEISLYWLYQYSDSGVEARGTQGSDNPDLEFNGVGVEVKAYGKIAHASAKGLGRFSSDKPKINSSISTQ